MFGKRRVFPCFLSYAFVREITEIDRTYDPFYRFHDGTGMYQLCNLPDIGMERTVAFEVLDDFTDLAVSRSRTTSGP